MDQTLSVTAGATSILNIGAPAAGPVGAADSVSVDAPGFGVTMQQAQQKHSQSAEGGHKTGGEGLPVRGESLPQTGAVADRGAEDAAQQSAPQSGSDQGKKSELASDVTDAVVGQMAQEVPASDMDGNTLPTAGQVLDQIGQFQQIDLSVAVDSALKQIIGKSEGVEVGLAARTDSVSGVQASLAEQSASKLKGSGSESGYANAQSLGQSVQALSQVVDSGNTSGSVQVINPLQGKMEAGITEPPSAVSDIRGDSVQSGVGVPVASDSPVIQGAVNAEQNDAAIAVTNREAGAESVMAVAGAEKPSVDKEPVGKEPSVSVRSANMQLPEHLNNAEGRSAPAAAAEISSDEMISLQTREPLPEAKPEQQSAPLARAVERVLTDNPQVVSEKGADVARQQAGERLMANEAKISARADLVRDPNPAAPVNQGVQTQPQLQSQPQIQSEKRVADTAVQTQSVQNHQRMSQMAQNGEQVSSGAATATASDAGVKSEGRQEALLTSFAESLAAARNIRQQAEPAQAAMQMTMPQGAKPGMAVWNQALNDRVMMLSSQNGRFAEIQLDPPELGSLQVKLQIKNDQVSLVFNSPHASVREAIEQGMPRLREMFEGQGLNLADSSVEDQNAGQQSSGEESESGYGSYTSGDDKLATESSEALVQQENLGLVDYYA